MGVLPAHQGLDARHPAGLEIYLGLVVEDQFAVLDGVTQSPISVISFSPC